MLWNLIMKATTIIKLSLVYLLLFSDIARAKGSGGHGGSHGSHHGGGSHGFGIHGSNSHGSNGGGGAISGCDEKSILFTLKQSVLVLFLEVIFVNLS